VTWCSDRNSPPDFSPWDLGFATCKLAEGGGIRRSLIRICIDRFGHNFCPGDKVMQVENDYDKEVYNGDLGVVSRIDMEEGELTVDFEGRKWSTASRTGRAGARSPAQILVLRHSTDSDFGDLEFAVPD
jgi:hypothetical protein